MITPKPHPTLSIESIIESCKESKIQRDAAMVVFGPRYEQLSSKLKLIHENVQNISETLTSKL